MGLMGSGLGERLLGFCVRERWGYYVCSMMSSFDQRISDDIV